MDSRIIVAHNVPGHIGDDFYESSRDVLVQVEAVEESIGRLGYEPIRMPFTRQYAVFIDRVREMGSMPVFNLCETVDEDPRMSWQPPALFEHMGIQFTGSPANAILLTTDKLITKRFLSASGIMTPRYFLYNGVFPRLSADMQFPLIAKPRFEDASIGIDQESVFVTEKDMKDRLPELFVRFGQMIVEEYIDGGEFNVSIFGHPAPRALPVARIEFQDYPEHLFRIVGYRAKWDETSIEFHNSSRTFPGDLDTHLVENLQQTALYCFRLFGLRDYGRIDVRVDMAGRIHVLEVNANPCISPDAGFPAAVRESGTNYDDMIQAFISFMECRRPRLFSRKKNDQGEYISGSDGNEYMNRMIDYS